MSVVNKFTAIIVGFAYSIKSYFVGIAALAL